MELRALRYFLSVAQEQSISAAAKSLHLSQPTLSIQLKSLEDELGVQLLNRGTKGSRRITLTEQGVILRKRAEEILSLVKRAEDEIVTIEDLVVGDVYIGAGETDTVRLFAEAAKKIQATHPGIHLHIFSGNAQYVLESLDKGLIDFGLLFSGLDPQKYEFLSMPRNDNWGVLMRKDTPLAQKQTISPIDLWDKPLIVSHQRGDDQYLSRWLQKELASLNIVATYNLVFNASLLVDEGIGYAICFDNLINTTGSRLCFRPLSPKLEAPSYMVWKRYQPFSKAAEIFLDAVRCLLSEN